MLPLAACRAAAGQGRPSADHFALDPRLRGDERMEDRLVPATGIPYHTRYCSLMPMPSRLLSSMKVVMNSCSPLWKRPPMEAFSS